jgi:hypothetical protein
MRWEFLREFDTGDERNAELVCELAGNLRRAAVVRLDVVFVALVFEVDSERDDVDAISPGQMKPSEKTVRIWNSALNVM